MYIVFLNFNLIFLKKTVFVKPYILLIITILILTSPGYSQQANTSVKNLNDTVRLINSKSNTLYAGIDNYLTINKNIIPYKNLLVEVIRGMVMEDEGMYIIMVGKPGMTRLNLYQYDKGDTVLCYYRNFQIKSVPAPYVCLNGENLEEASFITLEQLSGKKCFDVRISEDFVDQESWYEIKSITIGYSYGKLYVSKTCDGDSLSSEVLEELHHIAKGKEIALIFTLSGTGDIYKRTEPIRLKLY